MAARPLREDLLGHEVGSYRVASRDVHRVAFFLLAVSLPEATVSARCHLERASVYLREPVVLRVLPVCALVPLRLDGDDRQDLLDRADGLRVFDLFSYRLLPAPHGLGDEQHEQPMHLELLVFSAYT